MSKNHFEQLIEYVINDEDAKSQRAFPSNRGIKKPRNL